MLFYSLQARQLLFLCVELLLRDHAGVEQVLELLQPVGGACTGRSGLGGSCRHAVNDRLFAENEETLYYKLRRKRPGIMLPIRTGCR